MTAVAEARAMDTAEAVEQPEAAEPVTQSSRLREILIGAGVVAVGAVVLLLALQLPAETANGEFGSGWWPSLIGTAIAVLGLGVAAVGAFRPPVRDCDDARAKGAGQLVAILGLIVAYGVAWRFAHFLVVTPLLVLGIMVLLGGRGWRSLILIPVVVTVALYAVFGLLLRVPL